MQNFLRNPINGSLGIAVVDYPRAKIGLEVLSTPIYERFPKSGLFQVSK